MKFNLFKQEKSGFTASGSMKAEYCCTRVRIGEIHPIEGKDLIGHTLVNGLPVVVRKDQVKEGDLLFYVDNECQLNETFLRKNSLYEDPEMNDDHDRKGYFNKYGRVRIVKLGGVASMGYLFNDEELANSGLATKEQAAGIAEGTEFDTINGVLFVKAFVPPVKQAAGHSKPKTKKHIVNLFDRMIPGQFAFHYDTDQLEKNIKKISPDNYIAISVKEHGQSFICGNIKVKTQLSLIDHIRKFFGVEINDTEYKYIYSSRKVLKNAKVKKGAKEEVYTDDIWGVFAKKLEDARILWPGMTLYGEIVGYVSDTVMAQKDYDYGCAPGVCKLMVYRIVTEHDGEKFEHNVIDVRNWTESVIKNNPSVGEWLKPINILYWGNAKSLYSDLPVDENWHEGFMERLKNDKKTLGMEKNEPMCKNKVPREGIVLRIDNDPEAEAFKLKSMAFRFREAKEMDNGNVDAEMEETYGDN